MDKQQLIEWLRSLADEFQPFTRHLVPGSLEWNGSEYAPTDATEESLPDPYAMAWWSHLNQSARLLEAQDCELSPRQIEHLRLSLYGGMGSLLDFQFDADRFGQLAREADIRLSAKLSNLFKLFDT